MCMCVFNCLYACLYSCVYRFVQCNNDSLSARLFGSRSRYIVDFPISSFVCFHFSSVWPRIHCWIASHFISFHFLAMQLFVVLFFSPYCLLDFCSLVESFLLFLLSLNCFWLRATYFSEQSAVCHSSVRSWDPSAWNSMFVHGMRFILFSLITVADALTVFVPCYWVRGLLLAGADFLRAEFIMYAANVLGCDSWYL